MIRPALDDQSVAQKPVNEINLNLEFQIEFHPPRENEDLFETHINAFITFMTKQCIFKI